MPIERTFLTLISKQMKNNESDASFMLNETVDRKIEIKNGTELCKFSVLLAKERSRDGHKITKDATDPMGSGTLTYAIILFPEC